MHTTNPWRRPAAVAVLLAATTLAATGCDRRPTDPATPSTTPPDSSTTSPGTTVPDTATTPPMPPASAASQ